MRLIINGLCIVGLMGMIIIALASCYFRPAQEAVNTFVAGKR